MAEKESRFLKKSEYKLKDLELRLEEGDKVLECIKTSMRNYAISKGEIVLFKGHLSSMNLTAFQGAKMRNLIYDQELELTKGIGEFRYDIVNDDLFGRVRINYKENGKIFDGILTKGVVATRGLKIVLRYLDV